MIPDRIEVERGPGEMRWKLPSRDLGRARHLGWGGVVGFLFLSFMAFSWGAGLVGDLLEDGFPNVETLGPGDLFHLLFLLPALVMVVMGLRILWTGLTVVGNRTRTEVRVDRSQLEVRDFLGGWRKKRKWDVNRVARLEIARGTGNPDVPAEERSRTTIPWLPEDFWSVSACLSDGTSVAVALGYPLRVIQDLAAQLSSQLPAVSGATVVEEKGEAMEPRTGESNDPAPVPDAPEGMRVEMLQVADGVGFSVPAQGIWKGNHGLFLFGIVFGLFPVVFFGVILKAEGGFSLELLFPAAILSVFLLIGGGMAFAGLVLGTRKTMIAFRGERLRVETESILGRKNREWRKGEIASLEVAPTGTRVNNRALTALYVEETGGRRTGWLKMLSREEQEWVAAHLRNAR